MIAEVSRAWSLVPRHYSVMVRRGGRLVASVQAWPDGDAWWIGRLMVAVDHRRRGVATALLRHAQAVATSGTTHIRLNTGAASRINLRFYESEGFTAGPTNGDGMATLSKHLLPDERAHRSDGPPRT